MVAIDPITVLSRLSRKLGQSKAQVIERALKELDERIFWAEVSVAFERIAANRAEVRELKAEAALWEDGTGRDLAIEEW